MLTCANGSRFGNRPAFSVTEPWNMWIVRDQLGLFVVDSSDSGDTLISCYQFVNIPAMLRPASRLLLPVVFKWVLGRIARAAASEEGVTSG